MTTDLSIVALDPFGRGVPQAGVRIANERAILTLIAIAPGSSNAELARRSGLGPQTTSRIIADLAERGLIRRGQVLRGRRGQPATPLFLNPHGAYCFGVEIGWRHVQIALVDLTGAVLANTRYSHDYPDATTIFAEIASRIAAIETGLTPLQRQRIVGVGIASPTAIGGNSASFIADPGQGALWDTIDIAMRIAADTGLHADWFNDGNAACWAEVVAQPAPRPTGLAYFHIGAYIGAGIVADGRLWEGPTGNAANLGAIIVPDRHGMLSFVHHVASITAFETWLAQAGAALPPGNPQDWDWAALGAHADAWLDDAGRALALATLATLAVVEFDHVSIDGVMPRPIVTRLLERMRHHLHLLPAMRPGRPTVTSGSLGIVAAAKGAAQLLLYKRYFSRTWTDFGAAYAP